MLSGTTALGVSAYLVLSFPQDAAASASTMTPNEALEAAAKGEILLVDIRRPDEWARTGIPRHATNIDLRVPTFVDQVLEARISDTQPVAVICARGVRSARITRLLTEAGVGPLSDIPEGMLGSGAGPGWLKRGLPVQSYER